MSATDSVRRLLVLVPWLLQRPGAHVDEAAAAVGCDRATLLEDLALLNFCGLPGRLGGDLFETDLYGDRLVLRMAPAFEQPMRPSPEQALRLVLSLDHVAAAFGDELPGLEDALAVLRRVAGVPDGVRVLPEPADGPLAPLRAAVADGRVVRFAYRSRGASVAEERRVDPWRLVRHDGAWYLQGHDHDRAALRTFRLDRVEELRVDDETRTHPVPATLPDPVYRPGPDDVEVLLRVAPAGHWVLDALRAAEVQHDDDGGTSVRLRTDNPGWLVGLVLSARGHVEVVEPAALRERVVRTARAGLAAHREAVDALGAGAAG